MLTENQIREHCRNVRYFIGVYAADTLPKVTKFPATLIVNTDPGRMEGEHWVAMHMKSKCSIEYFDPFGFPPLIPSLQKFFAEYGRNGRKYSRSTMQNVNTTYCGDFCICFVKCVAAGNDLEEFVHKFWTTPKNNEKLLPCVKALSR